MSGGVSVVSGCWQGVEVLRDQRDIGNIRGLGSPMGCRGVQWLLRGVRGCIGAGQKGYRWHKGHWGLFRV